MTFGASYIRDFTVVVAAPTGYAPTTSEWPAISLPTNPRLILKVWRYTSDVTVCVLQQWVRNRSDLTVANSLILLLAQTFPLTQPLTFIHLETHSHCHQLTNLHINILSLLCTQSPSATNSHVLSMTSIYVADVISLTRAPTHLNTQIITKHRKFITMSISNDFFYGPILLDRIVNPIHRKDAWVDVYVICKENRRSTNMSYHWYVCVLDSISCVNPDSKVHGANMGPTWVLSAPDGPHVDPMYLVIREITLSLSNYAGSIRRIAGVEWIKITYSYEQKTRGGGGGCYLLL